MERNVIGVRPEVGELNSQQIGQLLSPRLEITAKAINHIVILFLSLWLLWGHHWLSLLSGDLGSHVSGYALFSSSQHSFCLFLHDCPIPCDCCDLMSILNR